MKTRGVKKSPGLKKAAHINALLANAVALDAAAPGSGLPEKTGITLDIDLKSVDDDANVTGVASLSKEEAPEVKDVKLDQESLETVKGIDAVIDNVEEDSLQIDDILEDEIEDEEEGDEEEEKDEVEDDVDESGDYGNDVNNEVENVAAAGSEKSGKSGDPTMSRMHHSKEIFERRKQKQLEVFIAGLNKEATEADIRSVFETVGKVTDIRLIRNPKSKKVKGYGFVRYADPLEAKQAVEKLNGTEVLGRPCRVSPSEENEILYLGNIGHSWTKEKILETLKEYGIENVENVNLIGGSDGEENHGFGFLEFTTHSDAFKAFKRLQRPDAIFGGQRSAKVAWAQILDEPDETAMLQVRSVFVDGMPPVWDDQKLTELCKKYGEIEQVDLASRKSKPKKKKFGFVKFVTREGAMACIEAINNLEVVEGDQKVKLKARLAMPIAKRKGVKRGISGGFPIVQNTGPQEVGESKENGRKRVGQSGALKRKTKKAKTIEKLDLPSNDRKNNVSSSKQRPSQGGKGALSVHEGRKSNKLTHILHPQSKIKKFKNPLRRTNFAAANKVINDHTPRRLGVHKFDDRYRSNALRYREARGRTHPYFDQREDLRYGEIPHADSRARFVEPEVLPVPYPGSQYARVSYIESPRRVPVGQVAQYAVVQGLAPSPATVIQQAPNYAVYGSSTTPVYTSGAYGYPEDARGGAYISTSYSGQPRSSLANSHYTLTPTNLGPYY